MSWSRWSLCSNPHTSVSHFLPPTSPKMRTLQRTSRTLRAASTVTLHVGSSPPHQVPLSAATKPACPVCLSAHGQHDNSLDTICEFHKMNPIPQRVLKDGDAMDVYETFPLPAFDKVSPETIPLPLDIETEHLEYVQYDVHPALSHEHHNAQVDDYHGAHDIDTPMMDSRPTRSLSLPLSFIPSSPIPEDPPSLSSSPTEPYGSWTSQTPEITAVSPVVSESSSSARIWSAPSPYADISRLRVDCSGRGCTSLLSSSNIETTPTNAY
ncbi:hypothetical protein DL93DRAFT_1439413 [Clavulina sp. PMI_390]|nr:hypothetical protein DL93DRAFT_1439413 [Clavulina sp. PMI_390]